MIASKLELVGAEMDALLILYCGFEEYSPAIMVVYGAKENEGGRKAIKRDFVVCKALLHARQSSLGNYS